MTKVRTSISLAGGLIRHAGNAIASREAGARRLCILNYHRVLTQPDPLLDSEPTIETFRWHMTLLARSFNVLPLHDAIEMLGTRDMPPRAVAVTFDDGYRSTHDLALPVLREFRLPATVFVTTGHIGKGSMWNDVILEATRRLPAGRLDLRELGFDNYSLGTQADRHDTARTLTERAKYLSPAERARLNHRLETLVGCPLEQELMLTREMLLALDDGGIEIGGHTVTHPILTCIDDDTAREEIVNNKQQLEAMLGKPLRLFAYPNGKPGIDFDERHARMVREAGYHAAFTTAPGPVSRHSERYTLPRSRPWDAHPLKFASRLLYWLSGRSV